MTTDVEKSGHEMAMEAGASMKTVRFSKLDHRYWKTRLATPSHKGEEGQVESVNYFVRIQYKKRRHLFDTGETEKMAAARNAADLYRSILSLGWPETIKRQAEKLGTRQVDPTVPEDGTLGALIAAFQEASTAKESSKVCYVRAIRKIYADINRDELEATALSKGKSKRDKVSGLRISSVTPDAVSDWKRNYLAGADGEHERRHRIITVNSLVRNAKAIFSTRVMAHLRRKLTLPEILPFAGVTMDKAPSTRYRSLTNAKDILKWARKELKAKRPESFKIVCLALYCGLRRAEIDSLLWSSVDFVRRVIHVESNEYYQLKSDDSHGEIDLGETFICELKEFKRVARSRFVVESDQEAVAHKTSGAYRCGAEFTFVTAWLRNKGIAVDRPLHELRKEAGSVVAQEHGIFAASRFLRHSDIRVTSQHYLDKKQRIVPTFA